MCLGIPLRRYGFIIRLGGRKVTLLVPAVTPPLVRRGVSTSDLPGAESPTPNSHPLVLQLRSPGCANVNINGGGGVCFFKVGGWRYTHVFGYSRTAVVSLFVGPPMSCQLVLCLHPKLAC